MKRIMMLFLMSIVLAASAAAYVSRLYPYELTEGANVVDITLNNPDEQSLRRAQLTVMIPQLDTYGVSGSFRVGSGRSARETMYLDVPKNAAPGYYPVIITLNSDDSRERSHTWVYIS